MSEKLDLASLPEAEALALIRKIYGYEEDEAQFYLGMVKGEITGDIVEEDSPADKGRKIVRKK